MSKVISEVDSLKKANGSGGLPPEKMLGDRLQKARQNAGLTQQQLCQRAGLSYSTLAKIERGAIKAPSIFTVSSIADVLDLSVEDLLGDSALSGKNSKRTSKRGVKFVYFDINGCLVRHHQAAFALLAEDVGATDDEVESFFWRFNDSVCRGELPIDEFNKLLSEQLGKPGLDWRDYYYTSVKPIKETSELVNWVADNYSIGLLSNIMPGQLGRMLEKGIVPNVKYDVIIESHKVNYIKPEIEIFDIAAHLSGRDVSEIMLIDDTRANITAAGGLGWHVAWFDDYQPEKSVERIKLSLEPA
jgi:FMN phosphatase YigB (HAD superfamily)/DNA-binding XRE family transcriptional regulator